MAGTVRGTFDLNVRPASTALRTLRGDADQTDRRLERLGKTMDGIGSPRQLAQLKRYDGQLRQLSRTATSSMSVLRREMASTEREVVRSVEVQRTAVGGLSRDLGQLGRTRATPVVDLNGVAEALAQVELLQRALSRLDGRHASPNVGFSGAAQVAAASAPASPASSGGGSLLTGLRAGPLSLAPSSLPLAAAALPIGQSLIGGAGALAGSAAQAGLGAGTIGIGGAGVLTGALASIGAVAIPVASRLSATSTALKNLHQQVLLTGKGSQQAADAQAKYNMALAGSPAGTRQFFRERTRLGSRLRRMTAPGASDLVGSGTNLFRAGNRLAPLLATEGNQFAGGLRQQSARLGSFASGGTSRNFLRQMGNEATNSLPAVEQTSENILATFMQLSVAARPFFHDFMQFISQWTGGWRSSSKDIGQTRGQMQQFVSQLKSFGRLTGASFDLLRDLLGAGAPSGQRGIDALTGQLREWDQWVQRNPAKVQNFFNNTMQSTQQIAGFLGQMVGFANSLATLLGPLLTQLLQVGTFLSNSGLLSVGGLPLLLAGGAGARQAVGAARGRISGVPGGGTGGGAGSLATTGLLAASLPGGRSGGIGGTGVGARGAAGYGRMALSRDPAIRAAGRGALGQIGRGAGGAFLRGAAGRLLPIQALFAGLDAMSFQGTGREKVAAGLNTLTLGVAPRPLDSGQKQDEVQQMVQQAIASAGPGRLGAADLRRSARNLAHSQSNRFFLPGGESFDAPTGTKAVMAKSLRQAARQRDLSATQRQIGQVGQAFDIRTGAGVAPRAAFRQSTHALTGQLAGLHGGAAFDFAQQSNRWIAQMKRLTPGLKGEANKAQKAVVGELRGMGQQVSVINGRIVKTSGRQWAQVRRNMTNQAELARQEVSQKLTALQRQMMAILQNMGVMRANARALVQLGEPQNQRQLNQARGQQSRGQIPTVVQPRGTRRRGGATGLRIPGKGLEDTVPIGSNAIGAPGELIVNRHTERRIDSKLRHAGTSLGREVGQESRKHSQMYRSFQDYDQHLLNDKGVARRFTRGGRSDVPVLGGTDPMSRMEAEMNRIDGLGLTYSWGGSHGQSPTPRNGPFDCSSAVSHILQTGGYGNPTMVSGQLASWGQAGRGPATIYANSGHTFMSLRGRFWGTSSENPGGGPGWHSARSASGYSLRTPPGSGTAAAPQPNGRKRRMAKGGRIADAAVAATKTAGLDVWLAEALQLTGHYSPQNLRLLHGRAMQESSGNPRSVNNWDSNAAAGHPSQGLLQTIPSTFQTYKLAGHNDILNPVDNAAAAVKYMFARYGHVVGPSGGGYSKGGRLSWGGWYGDGGSGTVTRPTMLGVGERGREHVEIRPHRGRGTGSAFGGGQTHQHSHVHFDGPVSVRSDDDIDKIVDKVGEALASEMRKADEVTV